MGSSTHVDMRTQRHAHAHIQQIIKEIFFLKAGMRLIYNPRPEEDPWAPWAASRAAWQVSEQPEISFQKNKLANIQETVVKADLWPLIHSHTYVHPHPYENTHAQELHSSPYIHIHMCTRACMKTHMRKSCTVLHTSTYICAPAPV